MTGRNPEPVLPAHSTPIPNAEANEAEPLREDGKRPAESPAREEEGSVAAG